MVCCVAEVLFITEASACLAFTSNRDFLASVSKHGTQFHLVSKYGRSERHSRGGFCAGVLVTAFPRTHCAPVSSLGKCCLVSSSGLSCLWFLYLQVPSDAAAQQIHPKSSLGETVQVAALTAAPVGVGGGSLPEPPELPGVTKAALQPPVLHTHSSRSPGSTWPLAPAPRICLSGRQAAGSKS